MQIFFFKYYILKNESWFSSHDLCYLQHKAGSERLTPISWKTPAPQYQRIERKNWKGKQYDAKRE